jgi:Fe-S-cluster-containing dehydrogenase component/DMSO reductase anchor subunit
MPGGFNFNIDKCVACHACVVGCSLENAFDIPWRRVFNDMVDIYPGLPVHNISMACNHCEEALCMIGCPANAYFRDDSTGAIRIIADRCIGCNYCYWNCPYDAPQYNERKKEIEKCNLCHDRLINNLDPACTTACPTGALLFSELDMIPDSVVNIFPDSGLKPGIRIQSQKVNPAPGPIIIPPVDNNIEIDINQKERKINPYGEWSLILFSFLSVLIFSFNISNWFGTVRLGITEFTAALVITLAIPLIHLGKPARSWRALSGILRSPLSNEIAALLLFVASSAVSYIFNIREVWVVSFIAGLILLISIDSVYTFSDRRFVFRIHPGQAFLSGLLISSFFLSEPLPFIFVAVIKVLLSFNFIMRTGEKKIYSVFILIQAIILAYLSATIYGILSLDILSIILLLVSEFISRVYYYIHFRPSSLTLEYFENNLKNYEKTITQ